MTNSTYDAIIIGAGHNGLVTAGYLARAGWKVLVLERRPIVGGACVTEEVFPGYRVSTASYLVSLLQAKVVRELELPRYGYKVFPKNPAYFAPYPDGRHLFMYQDMARTCQEISQVLHSRRGTLSRLRNVCRGRRASHRTALLAAAAPVSAPTLERLAGAAARRAHTAGPIPHPDG